MMVANFNTRRYYVNEYFVAEFEHNIDTDELTYYLWNIEEDSRYRVFSVDIEELPFEDWDSLVLEMVNETPLSYYRKALKVDVEDAEEFSRIFILGEMVRETHQAMTEIIHDFK